MTIKTKNLRIAPAKTSLAAGALSAAMMASPAFADAAGPVGPQTVDKDGIIVWGERHEDANPNANDRAPYKVEKSADGKFTEEVRDTPKTQYIIPKEVIEDIGATTFREVARSTPGVTLGTGEGGNAFGDRIFIRGYEARNDIYIDGLRDPGVTSREIFAIEQIEIVKGPSGSFGGRGTTGGLVSLQSKKPLDDNFVIAEGGVGTDNYVRSTVDMNWKASDSVALRVNGLFHDADTPGRDYVDSRRYGIASALEVYITPTVELYADYYHFRLDGMSDYGHPFDASTNRPYAVDRNNFYGAVGRDFLENGSDIATAQLSWKPSDAFEVRSISRYGKTFNRYVVSVPRAPRTVDPSDTSRYADDIAAGFTDGQLVIDTGTPQRNATNEYFAHMTSATARFDTGGLAHAFVFGGEYASEKITNRRFAFAELVETPGGDRITTADVSFTRDLFNPDPVLGFTIPARIDPTATPTVTDVESFSAFAIDTIDLTPQLKATLGIRYDSFDILSTGESRRSGPFSNAANVDFVNYQASLLYKPVEAASIYAGFATSSNPSGEQLDSTSSSYGGLGTGEVDLSPERNTSYELGAKYEINPDVLLTAAVFQIEKTNAREQTSPGVFELTGETRSRGFEFGLNGNITPRLSLFGGYTYLDAVVTRSVSDPAAEGEALANVPKHNASLLATYALTDRFSIGGQVNVRSEIYGGSLIANAGVADGYVRFDAVARYEVADDIEARVNVTNVTDEVYYDAIYRSGSPFAYVAPGRAATLTLTATF